MAVRQISLAAVGLLTVADLATEAQGLSTNNLHLDSGRPLARGDRWQYRTESLSDSRRRSQSAFQAQAGSPCQRDKPPTASLLTGPTERQISSNRIRLWRRVAG